jgi:hypothetical protein
METGNEVPAWSFIRHFASISRNAEAVLELLCRLSQSHLDECDVSLDDSLGLLPAAWVC